MSGRSQWVTVSVLWSFRGGRRSHCRCHALMGGCSCHAVMVPVYVAAAVATTAVVAVVLPRVQPLQTYISGAGIFGSAADVGFGSGLPLCPSARPSCGLPSLLMLNLLLADIHVRDGVAAVGVGVGVGMGLGTHGSVACLVNFSLLPCRRHAVLL